MAKLMGVQLKAVKRWEGMEGYGLSANLYIDNKKVGTVLDEGNGGMIFINVLREKQNLLDERRTKYFEKYPPVSTSDTDEESFIYELIYKTEDESDFKKFVKRGYPIMVATEHPIVFDEPMPVCERVGCKTFKAASDYIAEKKKEWPKMVFKTYGCLEDFIIE